MPNLQPRVRHVATPILSSALPSGLRTLQPAAPTAHTPARSTRIAQPLQYSSLALINALPSQRRIVAASLACYLAHAVRNPTHPTIRRGFASVLRLPVALSLSAPVSIFEASRFRCSPSCTKSRFSFLVCRASCVASDIPWRRPPRRRLRTHACWWARTSPTPARTAQRFPRRQQRRTSPRSTSA